jgi:hypothetical protein
MDVNGDGDSTLRDHARPPVRIGTVAPAQRDRPLRSRVLMPPAREASVIRDRWRLSYHFAQEDSARGAIGVVRRRWGVT